MLEQVFKLSENKTNVRTEVVAGITTFLTMAYIIFVNPNILSTTGMPFGAVFAATCLAAAVGTLLMAFLANYPIALAPGMGLNAYFAFVVVGAMKYSWQVALGCVFISGIIFFIISALPIREWIVNAIPKSLKMAIAAGIGLFLALTYVRARAPKATVVFHPSDHFVYPETRFLETVQRAVRVAESHSDRVVILGIAPDRLELDYGWIQPGRPLESRGGEPVQAVRSFVEKPSAAQADAALRAGALWNTLVLAAQVDVLWKLGWQCLPGIMQHFEQLEQAIGGPEETRLLNAMYRDLPMHNLSSDLLQCVPDHLAVIELTGVLWSDWGKPERIAETLRRIDRRPAFPLTCLEHPFVPLPVTAPETGPSLGASSL